jgi:hypothetical protein
MMPGMFVSGEDQPGREKRRALSWAAQAALRWAWPTMALAALLAATLAGQTRTAWAGAGAAEAAGAAGAAVAENGPDDLAVQRAIEAGKKALWAQWKDGHWPEVGKPGASAVVGEESNYGGRTALCAYALLACGEKPDGPRMKPTLEWLAQADLVGIYAQAMRVNAFALLGPRSPHYDKFRQDVESLIAAMDSRGRYDYVAPAKPPVDRAKFVYERYDNSVSQLAVLAVATGANNGVDVPKAYWRAVEEHWKDDQAPDGGWGYQKGGRAYGSMTAAGLATLYLCFDNNYLQDFVECRANTDFAPIAKGMGWLDKNFSASGNPGHFSWYYYYLYGLERVGLASGRKYFGQADWYADGVKVVLARELDGSWGDLVDSAFALLFLARGRGPILFNKLEYPGTWNCRPRDLANLTRWISRTFETQVHWQSVNIKGPVAGWHDGPILYISGATALDFTDDDVARLRDFVNEGGVIVSEAAGSRAPFTLAMTKFYERMFPQYPLKELDKDHPIYSLHFKISQPTGLWGVSNGVRLLAVHSPKEMSLAWQLNDDAKQEEAFNLGANVYFYVTDEGILPPRGARVWPVAREFTPVAKVKVTPVKYDGNYLPEPLAWKRFATLMGNTARVAVDVAEPTAIADLDPAAMPLAAMTGTGALTLSPAETAGLKKYLAGGGTLFVDAAGGDKDFADSAVKQLAELVEGGELDDISLRHALYSQGEWKVEKVAYRRALRKGAVAIDEPRLKGVTLQGRLAIIFSRDDLTAGLVGYPMWGFKGYEPASAFELMRNIVLYAAAKKE